MGDELFFEVNGKRYLIEYELTDKERTLVTNYGECAHKINSTLSIYKFLNNYYLWVILNFDNGITVHRTNKISEITVKQLLQDLVIGVQ